MLQRECKQPGNPPRARPSGQREDASSISEQAPVVPALLQLLGAVWLLPSSSKLHSEGALCQSLRQCLPTALRPKGTKTQTGKEITKCKDRDVALLSWDPDTAGEPSTALAVTFRWSLGTP